MKKKLFNDLTDYKNYEEHLFEQYKILVNSTTQVTNDRQKVNIFFVSAHAALLSLLGTSLKSNIELWILIIPATGMVICYLWLAMLKNYRELNAGKFKVIHKIEEKLPINLYEYEWDVLGEGKDPSIYTQLNKTEKNLSILFIGIHFLLLIGISIMFFGTM